MEPPKGYHHVAIRKAELRTWKSVSPQLRASGLPECRPRTSDIMVTLGPFLESGFVNSW